MSTCVVSIKKRVSIMTVVTSLLFQDNDHAGQAAMHADMFEWRPAGPGDGKLDILSIPTITY